MWDKTPVVHVMIPLGRKSYVKLGFVPYTPLGAVLQLLFLATNSQP